MKPLEAVARALCRRFHIEEHGSYKGLESDVDAGWPLWEEEARAALIALRDCGVAKLMQEAYGDMYGMGGSPEMCFRAMLDAALEE